MRSGSWQSFAARAGGAMDVTMGLALLSFFPLVIVAGLIFCGHEQVEAAKEDPTTSRVR